MFLPNHTQVPNEFVDEVMSGLNGSAVKVFIAICRKTIGWHKVSDAISYSQIEKMTGLGWDAVRAALDVLEKLDIITVNKAPGLTNVIDLAFMTTRESREVPPGKAGGDHPEKPEGTSRKSRDTKETVKQTEIDTSSPSAPVPPSLNASVKQILCDLATRTGRSYRLNAGTAASKAIAARLRDGWEVKDFLLVNAHKAETWLRDPKMADYVRPSTLYRISHFEDYVLAARAWSNPHPNVPRETDDERKMHEIRRKMGLAS
jgi:phage replication O-like protein O